VRSYRASGGGQAIAYPADRVDQVRRFFESDELEVWTLTPSIAEAAADLGNDHPELSPADCVHIATALAAKARVHFRFDGVGKRRRPRTMLALDGQLGSPPLRILEPFDPWPTLWIPAGAQEPPQLASQPQSD
jgi:hypothetical protein